MTSSSLVEVNPHHLYYEEICCGLNVDGDTSKAGWRVYERITGLNVKPMKKTERSSGSKELWTVCSLFIASIVRKQVNLLGDTAKEGNCMRLTQLLKETGVRFNEFLEHAPFLFSKLGLDQEAVNNLKLLKDH